MARVPGMPIIVLTNDVDNRRKAQEMGINAMSVQARLNSPWVVDVIPIDIAMYAVCLAPSFFFRDIKITALPSILLEVLFAQDKRLIME